MDRRHSWKAGQTGPRAHINDRRRMGGRLCLALALVWGVFAWPGAPCANAAYIERSDEDGITLITITGDLVADDLAQFRQVSAGAQSAMVVMASPGGSLLAGIEIGKTIRLRGFNTMVMPADACVSACALAWLGGHYRFMAPRPLIGFHAAWVIDEEGVQRETGSGNALVGAYLTNLGLPEQAVYELTSAAPDELVRFDEAFARRHRIAVEMLDPDDFDAPAEPAADPPAAVPPGAQEGRALLGQDLPGGDFERADDTTFPACHDLCLRRPGCVGLTFNTRHNVCFLKRTLSHPVDHPDALSWIAGAGAAPNASVDQVALNGVSLEGVDLPGHDFKRVDGVSYASCRAQCADLARCRALTYNTRHRVCFMKSGAGRRARHGDARSWIR